MGIGVFGTIFPTSNRHPRGVLVEDPDLSEIDSRQDNSGMTASKSGAVITQEPNLSTNTKSASPNAEMNESVHVLLAWMPVKAM